MAKTSVELSKSLSEIRSLRFTARGGPALAGVPSPGEAANKKNPPEMVDFLLQSFRHIDGSFIVVFHIGVGFQIFALPPKSGSVGNKTSFDIHSLS